MHGATMKIFLWCHVKWGAAFFRVRGSLFISLYVSWSDHYLGTVCSSLFMCVTFPPVWRADCVHPCL